MFLSKNISSLLYNGVTRRSYLWRNYIPSSFLNPQRQYCKQNWTSYICWYDRRTIFQPAISNILIAYHQEKLQNVKVSSFMRNRIHFENIVKDYKGSYIYCPWCMFLPLYACNCPYRHIIGPIGMLLPLYACNCPCRHITAPKGMFCPCMHVRAFVWMLWPLYAYSE